MRDTLNVRWHSRAGQGAVTAANFFAEALAQFGYKVQSFPDFGAEKRGAPVVVFNRFSNQDESLDDPAHLKYVDLVVLFDTTLLGDEVSYDDILKHLGDNGLLVINTAKTDPSKFNKLFNGVIHHVNASGIALDTIKRNIPNVAMMGALTKILEIDKDKMKITLELHLSKVFPEALVQKNMIGFDRGYGENIIIPN